MATSASPIYDYEDIEDLPSSEEVLIAAFRAGVVSWSIQEEPMSQEPEPGDVVTDSAGTTARYTPISEIEPGDTLLIGWRSMVTRVERDGRRCRLWTEGWDVPATPWVNADLTYPVEVGRNP